MDPLYNYTLSPYIPTLYPPLNIPIPDRENYSEVFQQIYFYWPITNIKISNLIKDATAYALFTQIFIKSIVRTSPLLCPITFSCYVNESARLTQIHKHLSVEIDQLRVIFEIFQNFKRNFLEISTLCNPAFVIDHPTFYMLFFISNINIFIEHNLTVLESIQRNVINELWLINTYLALQ